MSAYKHYPPQGFTERLYEAWLKSGMEITELSKRSKVSRSSVYSYVFDGNTPNATALASMCRVLDVSADYLLFGKAV